MTRILASLFLLLLVPSMAYSQLRVSSDFEGGSAKVVWIDSAAQKVHIQPAVERDRGWPCWWYCRLDGLTVGADVNLTVSANPLPFMGTQILNANWSLPDHAALSDDDHAWRRTEEGSRQGDLCRYEFVATKETMWVAWGPPMLPSHVDRMLRELSQHEIDSTIYELARTRSGRPVNAIRIGASPNADSPPFGIWIQARQHAWEAGSSWVARGFLEWLVGDDSAAVDLRSKATIHVVPVMDVDSVYDGRGGKASVPRDHNRDWDDRPIYPEVAAAQRRIRTLHQDRRFDLFLDLHNPGPNDRRPFFFAANLEELPTVSQRNWRRWLAIAARRIDDLEVEPRFASYIKTTEERNRVSSNWVRQHTSPHVVSMTLETAWNRPAGDADGYRLVGRQLGQAIADYFAGDPSP